MGTSKKHLNSKIKKLLEDKKLNEINTAASEISKVILSKESLGKSLENEETINKSIEIAAKHFTLIEESGFKDKSKKEVLEDKITLQEFLEMILEEIDTETNIDSKILVRSLKIVMTKILEMDINDSYIFAQLLFHQVTKELLQNELYETLKDSYENLPYDKIRQMVVSLTNKIMNNDVHRKINNFVDNKITFSQLLDIIINATDEAEFGEF